MQVKSLDECVCQHACVQDLFSADVKPLQESPALLCRTILHSFYTRDLHKDSALLFLHNRYTMRLKPSTGHANVTAICNELGGLVAGPRRFTGICNTRLSTVSERDASTSSVWCAGP